MSPRPLIFALLLAAAARGSDEARFWRALDRSEGLPSDDILDLCASGPDRVWAATGAGLCLIEAQGVRVFEFDEGIPRHVAVAPGGQVYALYPKVLIRAGPGDHERIALPADPALHPPGGLASEPDGTAFLLMAGKVHRRLTDGDWEPGERDPSKVAPPPGPVPGAPAAVFKTIRFRGEIWGATRSQGILRRRVKPRFRSVELPGADRVHAPAAAPDGTIWCGTENGLVRIQPDGRAESFAALLGRDLGTVTAIAVDRDGRVWAGSGSSFTGVYRLDPDGWVHLDAIDGFVHRINSDSTGALWFAALNAEGGSLAEGRGAWSFSGGAFRPAPANVELPSRRVYDVVARDPSGILWFATRKGLAAYEGPQRITYYSPSSGLRGERVWCLCAGSDGSLWVGYQQERGVTRLASGRMDHFGVEHGLCDGNVWAIVEGRREVFWFATESGVSRFDGVRWSCFRDEEGLGLAPIWPLLPMPDGSVWIGTLGAGLVHMVPGDTAPPKTRFTAPSWRASPGERVEVSWTGTDTWDDTPSRDLWYRWRVDGGRWSDAGLANRIAREFEPGRHVLQVQAVDRFGNAESPPAAVEIVVAERAPSLWPIYAGAGVLLLAVGFLIGRRGRTGS